MRGAAAINVAEKFCKEKYDQEILASKEESITYNLKSKMPRRENDFIITAGNIFKKLIILES